jgi:glycosyltransferase involved in cell wall biosynthesis
LRVLLLNQTFYPDVASTAQHASDLARRLVERGHDVTVVCSRRAYDRPQRQYARRETWSGVEVHRIAALGFGKKTRWRRTADFGSYLLNCSLHMAVLRRFDVVIAMTSPPLVSCLGALFTMLKGGRLLFWVMDLNPDEALAAGWLREGSLTAKGLSAMLNFSLRRATKVVVLDRFMASRVAAKAVAPDKLAIVPPWSHDDVVRYDHEGRERFRREHGLDGKYVVMYSGNHSPCHPLATILEAARRMRDRSDVVFCFVGGGSEFESVRRFVSEHGLDNVLTLPYQPLARLSASLSSADLHVVVMGDPFVGIVHPCKVYNVRTLGIPYVYIGPEQSHITDLSPPYAAKHGEVERVVGHIRDAAAAPGRAAVDAWRHSQQRLVEQMVSLVEHAAAAPIVVGPGAARRSSNATQLSQDVHSQDVL